ncbi:MAG: hypothetical protein JW940_25860, partial [Polyangiaceae bacterium]|nr:hypothetical protein [Polyangiaceae bacterium]
AMVRGPEGVSEGPGEAERCWKGAHLLFGGLVGPGQNLWPYLQSLCHPTTRAEVIAPSRETNRFGGDPVENRSTFWLAADHHAPGVTRTCADMSEHVRGSSRGLGMAS